MDVLVGCEESQAVCLAFLKEGHNAWSCDIQPCSGGRPDRHLQMDVEQAIDSRDWDIIILHPPCTAIAVSGNRWYGIGKARHIERIAALAWTLKLWRKAKARAKIGVALENPVGVLSKHPEFGVPQYIQPWQFGHGETKKTGLWLFNLPPLKPTNIVEGREQRVWKMPPSADRAKLRSKTYAGIANAMASQWTAGRVAASGRKN